MNAFLETRSYSSDFAVSAFYAANNNFLAHWHLEVEMMLVCSGNIRIGINKEARVLHQGEMALFRSTDIHYYDSRDLHSRIIVLIFRPELIGSPGGWPENRQFDPAFIDQAVLAELAEPIRNGITALFEEIVAELETRSPHYRLYVSGKIAQLCALILRHFPTRPVTSPRNEAKKPDILRVQKVIQHLETHYMEEISLAGIARMSGLSPYYFSRLFAKFTGITFKEYLTRIRVQKAEQLIQTGQKSMIDTAFDCGFNSVRTFNRAFRTVKGYPPSRIG
ncbi:AraC-like DNA-binding protein [Hydrogenispora ethanolica]|uniref:AraC-like DNA-binding protein n=1 Tax=Hydrogenispora ethanolica TaxID=1082276 RepID=A0A4R1R9M5_HYDET|nr:helix-turn-helix domain-containing protein [Hydrogenispora ethanolica]TCL62385.1 AraC-like DNA-binding protein [Hydrogenispora ethanolica]